MIELMQMFQDELSNSKEVAKKIHKVMDAFVFIAVLLAAGSLCLTGKWGFGVLILAFLWRTSKSSMRLAHE